MSRDPVSPLGRPLFELSPPEATRLDLVSVNWCDRTTWYPSSELVTDEVFTNMGDNMSYTPAIVRPWIDMNHGKLTGERSLRPIYSPIVKVNDLVKTEHSPGVFNNDYGIDYNTGIIVFATALDPSDTVKVTYHYENGSSWVIKPKPGKKIRLAAVEVQFSEDVELTDTVLFQAHGLVDVFAPQYVPSPYPSGTLIPLGEPTAYQTMQDYVNEAAGSYPSVPKMGGDSWRGMSGPLHIFRWPYAERGTTDLISAAGMEIRVTLENNTPFGGSVAVATFYAITEDE